MEKDVLPGWAKRFLRTICPTHLVEEIEGDLVQKHIFDIQHYGLHTARRKLIWNILRFFRSGIFFRRQFVITFHRNYMLRSHLLMAWRVARRQGLYSFINIFGLSVGLAATLMIGTYIIDELNYDRHIKDATRIYRVGINETFRGDEILYSDTGAPLASAMQNEIPEVESTIRITGANNLSVQYEDRSFFEKKAFYADSNFFQFFSHALSQGNPTECLKGPNKVVLSATTARKYFDAESPIGKQLKVGNSGKLTEVSGVFPDLPQNTHMKIDMILSMESLEFSKSDCWGCYGLKTYFKIHKNAAIGVVEKKLSEFAEKRIIPVIERDMKISHSDFVKSGDRVSFFVHPMTSIHLHSNIDSEFEPNGDIRYIYVLGIVALFLIAIACINFMNLSTARAIGRAKEVGVRKTMGAFSSGLVWQFMLESLVYVFTAGVLAIAIAFLCQGPFNRLSGKELQMDHWNSPVAIGSIIGFLLLVGILAGAYPSFYLTSFKPATVLKGGKLSGSGRSLLRSSLVIVQFTISIGLIMGTLIIDKQVKFIQHKNLGFEKENVLTIGQSAALGENARAFKTELLSHPQFVRASFSNSLPPNIRSTAFMKAENSERVVGIFFMYSDYDLQKTMGYKLRSGRYFSEEFPSDSSAVVINEACAKLLGYVNHEGKTIEFWDKKLNVIGIVEDFNFASLKSAVQPLAIFPAPNIKRTLALRLAPGDPSVAIEIASATWNKYANGKPFEYTFLDEDFDALFRSEQRLGSVFATFTVIAIFIACLGLFGLITFVAGQRTKEIGVRKLLGASLGHITLLLLSDLMKLVLISFLIAIPLSWYGLEQWLQSFAYRTSFDVYVVIVAGGSGLLLAVLTVGYRSIRAAAANPVESLRNE